MMNEIANERFVGLVVLSCLTGRQHRSQRPSLKYQLFWTAASAERFKSDTKIRAVELFEQARFLIQGLS